MAFGLFPFFLLLFIAFPIAEIALLIYVGGAIGTLATLAIVIGTAILGTSLLRLQGFGVLSRVNQAMDEGKMPVVQVMEGMFLLIAGAFLLTPGLITDSIGFILLIPPFRIAIARWILSRMLKSGSMSWQVHTSGGGQGGPFRGEPDSDGFRPRGRRGVSGDDVIEGEFERVDEDKIDPDQKR